ncbi:chorismate mutase [Sporosarcina ureilytica]|uniref:chorismate mutase n=1 Tax=Sporosarcina ureilytica TaxID=298596 RepID=A0A1D8JHA5_9BACL|nr:chorismate mutase [Sporosarcina ureilytica]
MFTSVSGANDKDGGNVLTVRGLRGATTIASDNEQDVLQATGVLVQEMAQANHVLPEDIVSVLISTTADIQSAFPAKAVRSIEGWKYVPVMCTHEMNVPGGMPLCIRILLHANCTIPQKNIIHIYQNEAVKLRPDLQK